MQGHHQSISPSVLYFGTPVVLIVTCNADGSPNISPMSSAWALGSSVILGLGAGGQAAANLRREEECTLNFPSADLWSRVEKIAPTTGVREVPPFKLAAGYSYEKDKFTLGGFTPQESQAVRPPRITECPLQFEARLLACHESKAHPEHLILEVAVDHVHALSTIVVAGTNHIDTEKWNPLYYVFRHYFGNAVDLGKSFKAEH